VAWLAAGVHAAEETRPLDYPKDLRAFRIKALKADGVFAPDIAFALRFCPRCGKPYVFGTFPRLKRQPWENLAAVHEVIESNVVRKTPPKSMFSAKQNKYIPRACPNCDEPEDGARPDKVLFCHVFPETGEDMQIEYDVNNKHLGAKTFWKMGAVKRGAAADPAAVKVDLSDESEEGVKKAYGVYFSLRAIWNGIFAAEISSDRVTYREVSPGMRFIFRPLRVGNTDFKKFADETLAADRDKGAFSRLESPLKIEGVPTSISTYKEWAAKYGPVLGSDNGGGGECFVAVSYPELHKAAEQVLASRGVGLEIAGVNRPSDPGVGILKKGDYRYQVNFGPLALECVVRGSSLHEGCALLLATPAYTLDLAERLDAAIRSRRPFCTYDIREGRFLALRDEKNEERVVDVISLCDKIDPENAFQFDLFTDLLLAWDSTKKGFGPKPNARDVSPAGLPAFIERRVRPAGFLKTKERMNAFYEPREDTDHVRYDLCYTSECTTSLVYVNPDLERFKGMTIEDAKKVYDSLGCTLPMHIDKTDLLNFPGDTPLRLGPARVVLCLGVDLASLGAEDGRGSALAQAVSMGPSERVHIYAISTNAVAITTRKLIPDEFKLVKSRIDDLLKQSEIDPGYELGLHFDLPRVEPRGKVLRRMR